LNCIENLWAALKHHIRKYVKPKNKEELVAGIKEFWGQLTIETCSNYIRHVHKVLPAIVASEGGPTKY
jgi:transposase